MLRFGSLFSGIGGFDLGFERAGMRCAWQVEIDGKCNEVLAQHWPDVRRYGDVRDVGERNLETVDLICGGFPCQDLSVAGKREGLAGERSGLWFEFHRVLAELKPRWAVIENVPGLLSSNGGADFAVILRGLVELGYGVAWRVLDAQYFGVAQRRRRVFVVGSLGDGRAAQVLFKREGSAWHTAPGREAGQGIAAPIKAGTPSRRNGGSDPITDEFVIAQESQYGIQLYDTAGTLREGCIPEHQMVTFNNTGAGWWNDEDISRPLSARDWHDSGPGLVAPTLTAPDPNAPPRDGKRQDGSRTDKIPITLALTNPGSGGRTHSRQIAGSFGVRRLTPIECERLQGFPDGHTGDQSDSTRYRQLGNAVCVPVAEWLGRQIIRAEYPSITRPLPTR